MEPAALNLDESKLNLDYLNMLTCILCTIVPIMTLYAHTLRNPRGP